MDTYSVAHVMSVIGVMLISSLSVSLVCWAVLGSVLHKVLGLLCDDPREEVQQVGGEFWRRLYALLILMVPMLSVLLFAPDFSSNIAFNLLYALRASFIGGVTVLLVLAHLVRKQIQFIQHHRLPNTEKNSVYSRVQLYIQQNLSPPPNNSSG